MPDVVAPVRAWRTVLEKIESDLLDGLLTPGDHLPPERELAASLGVGRSSVREALRVLDALGLIRTATGSGPTAGAVVISTPGGAMATLLRLQVAAHGFALRDVVSTRLILESAVADRLATAFADSRHQPASVAPPLADARAALDAMDAADLTPDEFLGLDAQFHLALAEASGNTVVAAVMAGLREAIESYVREGAVLIADWADTTVRLRAQHREIVAAVQAGDPARARRLITEHITGYYAHTGLTRD